MVANTEAGGIIAGAEELAGGKRRQVWAVAFAGVEDGEVGGATGVQEELEGGDYRAGGADVVALVGEVASFFADLERPCQAVRECCRKDARVGFKRAMMRLYLQSRCMSIMTRAVLLAESDLSCGQLYGMATM